MREEQLRIGGRLGIGRRDARTHQILGFPAGRLDTLVGQDARVEQQPLEPAEALVRALLEAGILTKEHAAAVKQECEDLMRAGIQAAEAEPAPDPELLFSHAYVDPPGNMRHG